MLTRPRARCRSSIEKVAVGSAPQELGDGEVGGVVSDDAGNVTVVWAGRQDADPVAATR